MAFGRNEIAPATTLEVIDFNPKLNTCVANHYILYDGCEWYVYGYDFWYNGFYRRSYQSEIDKV